MLCCGVASPELVTPEAKKKPRIGCDMTIYLCACVQGADL